MIGGPVAKAAPDRSYHLSILRRRLGIIPACLGLSAFLLLTACSSQDEAGTSTPTTLDQYLDHPELTACEAPEGAAAESECLNQVATVLQSDTFAYADGEEVTHASFAMVWTPLIESLSSRLEPAFSASYNSPIGDLPEEESAVTPISVSLSLGSSSIDLWVCFDDDTVTVGPGACP